MSFNYIIRKTIVLAFFEKFTKTWRKSKAPPLLDLYDIPENSKFCVVRTLDGYLKATKQRRFDSQLPYLKRH